MLFRSAAYGQLAELFGRIVVSDLAWARTLRWRAGLAEAWPEIRSGRTLRVAGPRAEALLLRGWLKSRLHHDWRLAHEDARMLRRVEIDGQPVQPARAPAASASDLLSAELEQFARDRVYEAAVRKA